MKYTGKTDQPIPNWHIYTNIGQRVSKFEKAVSMVPLSTENVNNDRHGSRRWARAAIMTLALDHFFICDIYHEAIFRILIEAPAVKYNECNI